MDNMKAYFLGWGTLALLMVVGFHSSPDYMEFVSNGNNFLIVLGFALIVILLITFVEHLDKVKKDAN